VWIFLLTVYAFVLLTLTATAAGVALFASNNRRAARATRVLTTLLVATLGGGGVFTLAIRLHQTGLL
jgi:hypothetical protein